MPIDVGALKSPDVTRLSHFLERNAIPFRVVDPDPEWASDPSLHRQSLYQGEDFSLKVGHCQRVRL
jgi:hypothetical protein